MTPLPWRMTDEGRGAVPSDVPGSVPGGWMARRFECGDFHFDVTAPARPDELLDDPAVLEANRRDDYMPYWGYVWQASGPMAAAVLAAEWTTGATTLELGSGVGVVGLAGLARGLDLTFSDYDPTSVALSVHNARRNGYPRAEGILLDWRQPLARRFSVILGSDVTYERRNHAPLLDVIDAMLEPDGLCWIGDAGRQVSAEFPLLARTRGYSVRIVDDRFQELSQPHVGQFQMFILTRRAAEGWNSGPSD